MQLEKEAKEQLGWSAIQIARSSESQIAKALKTPLLAAKISSSSKTPVVASKTPVNSQELQKEEIVRLELPSLAVNKQVIKPDDYNGLVQLLQNLQMRYASKSSFRTSRMERLEKDGDLSYLDKALEKDMNEIRRVKQEINEVLLDISADVANKRDLLQILDPSDASVPQIKLRIDQLCAQIECLKSSSHELA